MQAKIVSNSTRIDLNVMGMLHALRLQSADTNGALMLAEAEAMPGMGVPPHIHQDEDETFHILAGEVEFWLDGKTFVAGAGTTAFLPRNIAHGFRIVGDKPAHLLVYVSPAGLEEMFKELSGLPAGEPDVQAIMAICTRYNIEFLPMIK